MSHMTLKKPAQGTAAKARKARRAAIERAEKLAKAAAKRRDRFTCRRCGARPIQWDDTRNILVTLVEAMHIVDAGMGGRASVSSHQRDYVTGCPDCHRGPRSVHSGHLRIVAGPAGGDGPVEFVSVVPGRKKCGVSDQYALDACH